MFDKKISYKRHAGLLLLLISGLVAYNTFMPFRFYGTLSKILFQIGQIEWTPFRRNGHWVSWTDIIGNVILFIPVGCAALLYGMSRQMDKKSALRFAVFYSVGLSFMIETVQIVLRYRVTSVHDVLTNSLGGFAGATAVLSLHRERARIVLRRLTESLFREHTFVVAICLMLIQIGHMVVNSDPHALTGVLPLAFLTGYFLQTSALRVNPRIWIYILATVHLIISLITNIERISFVWSYEMLWALLFGWGIFWQRKRNAYSLIRLWILIYLIGFYAYPFRFQVKFPSDMVDGLKHFTPFYFYYKSTGFMNLWDMFHMGFVGMLTAGLFISDDKKNAALRAMMLIVLMETSQWFIQGRLFDITDIFIAWGGIVLMMLVQPYIQAVKPASKNNNAEKAPAVSA